MKFNVFQLNPFVVWIIVRQSYGEYTVTVIRLLSNTAGSTQFSVLSDNEIVRCQGHVCLIMKIGNQFESLGKCTKA